MARPVLTVAIPTRNRAAYLAVALRSLRRQRTAFPFEVVVVDDGSSDTTAQVAREYGARVERFDHHRGLNAARNRAIELAEGELIAFLDDDVRVPPGWVSAVVRGAQAHPESEVFGGPIRPCIEGNGGRGCGRERPPITTLDLGPEDREADRVWGANMVIRKRAFARYGPFDERIGGHGDEEEWLERLRANGGRITYLARAWVEHRRAPADATLRALCLAAYRRGRAARASDRRRGKAPAITKELAVFAGCLGHAARYRCRQGLVMAAHSLGRLRGAVGG